MARSNSWPKIWEVPDGLWERVEWLLREYDPPKTTGRSRTNARGILNGIIFRFRTGCDGITSQKSTATTPPSIALFNVGWRSISSR
jgi:transposase